MLTPIQRVLTTARLLAVLSTAPAYGAELTISLANIESDQGQLMVAVLSDESAFRGEKAAQLSVLLPPRKGQVSFTTDALAPGTYAVQVMHDENGNGELDNNLVGMPTEPWGFSNNAMGSFGPPGWQDVSFDLEDNTLITIDLNH
jgi:uncharacterized protein (DUF2141 family)